MQQQYQFLNVGLPFYNMRSDTGILRPSLSSVQFLDLLLNSIFDILWLYSLYMNKETT